MRISTAWLTLSVVILGGDMHTVLAGSAADKCEAGKNEEAGKYALCRAKAAAKLALRGEADAHSAALVRCATKLIDHWARLEEKAIDAGDTCPTTADQGQAQGSIDAVTANLAALLAGITFADNGDGTVTDEQTGLMWEKKTGIAGSSVSCSTESACPDPHHVNNIYDWSKGLSAASGTVFSNFLGRLNGAYDGNCFNGHCDWRLPTQAELQTILLNPPFGCFRFLCIDTTVFGPTRGGEYWVIDTLPAGPTNALFVSFYPDFSDFPGYRPKDSLRPARAVRSVM
jgi:hypothetical protein